MLTFQAGEGLSCVRLELVHLPLVVRLLGMQLCSQLRYLGLQTVLLNRDRALYDMRGVFDMP